MEIGWGECLIIPPDSAGEMRWCTREAGRGNGNPPPGQMAVARPILQNPLPGHGGHRRGESALERRAGEARAPGPNRRPAQPILAGNGRRIRGAGAAEAPRPRLGSPISLPRNSAKRRAPRPSQGTTAIGASFQAPPGGPPRQTRPAAADAPAPRSELAGGEPAPGTSRPHRSIVLSGSSRSQPEAVSGCSSSHSALNQSAVASPAVVKLRRLGIGPRRLATWLKPGLWPQIRM